MIDNMKRRAIILFAAALLIFPGCAEERLVSTELGAGEDLSAFDARKFGRTGASVAVPFKAAFHTIGGVDPTSTSCGAPPRFLNVQDGEGKATHLGKFTVHITFCNDVTDLLDDGQLTAGESIPYDNGVGTFTAANGDELSFTISGAVLPSDHPDFDFEFADPFVFTGGTGRFEGASGGGVTDSFHDLATSRTEHMWAGTLTFLPGL